MESLSSIQLCGSHTSKCGYCHQEDSSASFGMIANRLTVRDYQVREEMAICEPLVCISWF